MSKVEEVQLDEPTLKAIVDKTAEAAAPAIAEAVEKSQADLDTKIEEATNKALDAYLEKTEKAADEKAKKAAAAAIADDPLAKALEDGKVDKEVAEMNAAKRFYQAMLALSEENWGELKRYSRYGAASQMKARGEAEKKGMEALAKAGYANETTAADGSVLIPDAEFVTQVFDNLPRYGVAFADADVRQTDRTSVRVLSLDSGLTFYSTAEAGVKTSAKLAFAKNEVSLQKFAVIVPATDELVDDAVIDYWNLVTRELTRAYARKADELVFTDATYGITNLAGIITEPVSGAGTTITWDDLLAAEGKTEDDQDTSNYKWYMRKETWFRLIQLKGSTNDHYLSGSIAANWAPNPNSPTTPWGTPVQFTRVLPTSGGTTTSSSAVVGNNDAFAVYGDLKNCLLYNKRGMALKMLTEATIVDSEGTDLNLATQDASAMRAVVRMLHICPKGSRGKFVVVGTGTVS